MDTLYFKFLQTIAAFVVKAVKIDSNKDGKISGAEIMSFITLNLMPLFLNINGLKEEAQAFWQHVKSLTFKKFKKDLDDIVRLQLLPDELEKAEVILDRIAGGLKKVLDGAEELYIVGVDLFGNDEEEVVLESPKKMSSFTRMTPKEDRPKKG